MELIVSDRGRRITSFIPDPNHQQPSLIVLLGNKEKTAALRKLFGVSRARQFRLGREGSTDIHLNVDPSSIFGIPLLLADGDISSSVNNNNSLSSCHDSTRHTIKRSLVKDSVEARSGIFSQILGPFTDVFCFFAGDIGGVKNVAHSLVTWINFAYDKPPPALLRPHVAIVLESSSPSTHSENEALGTLLGLIREETSKDIFESFSTIEVVELFPSTRISDGARYRSLKDRLMARLLEMRIHREYASSLFSLTHFLSFLDYACAHFSCTDEPFNFIKATRDNNPLSGNLVNHLTDFLQQTKPGALLNFAAPVIASSFFLDHYLPDTHCKRLYIQSLNSETNG